MNKRFADDVSLVNSDGDGAVDDEPSHSFVG
jgi:hypothetical protein